MDKEIVFRISDENFEKIQKISREKNITVDQIINQQLQQMDFAEKNFEQRQIVGSIVDSKQLNKIEGLVNLFGNFYRYDIADNNKISKKFIVQSVSGNVVLLTSYKENK